MPKQRKKTAKKQQFDIGYRISDIEVIEFFSKPAPTDMKDGVGFTVRVQYGIPSDLNHILLRTTVRMVKTEPGGIDSSVLSQLVTQFIFDTQDLGKYKTDEGLEPPQDFLQNLANISVSTSRGIFLAKNYGGPYSESSYIMPPIDSEELLPRNVLKIWEQEQMKLGEGVLS